MALPRTSPARSDVATPEVARRLAALLGLGMRGRLVVVGVEQVRSAAQRGRLECALVAPDASANSREKIVPLLTARRVRMLEPLGAAQLGAAVGRETTAAVGILDAHLARGVRSLVESGSGGAR